MEGGTAGTIAADSGTSGGQGGMNGAQRRLALVLAAGFVLIMLAIMAANAESMMSDLVEVGVHETAIHVWMWEATSIVAWLTLMPPIWWLVLRLRRSGLGWVWVVLVIAVASLPVSLWHIGLMVGLRKIHYALEGSHYDFFDRFRGSLVERMLYEYRKDVVTYLQFAALATIGQWLLARAADPPASAPDSPSILTVADGAVTHQVPLDEIDHVSAAGNYVEIAWGTRTLLQRATLAGVAAELSPGFVQIHRSRLVRRSAIRRIETDRSGDFTVELADGTALKGSRRYRESVQG